MPKKIPNYFRQKLVNYLVGSGTEAEFEPEKHPHREEVRQLLAKNPDASELECKALLQKIDGLTIEREQRRDKYGERFWVYAGINLNSLTI
jgi:hypothetical protein